MANFFHLDFSQKMMVSSDFSLINAEVKMFLIKYLSLNKYKNEAPKRKTK